MKLKYNLIEFNDIYSETCEISWQYCRDEKMLRDNDVIIDFADNNTADPFKSIEKLKNQTDENDTKNAETIAPFKYLSICQEPLKFN